MTTTDSPVPDGADRPEGEQPTPAQERAADASTSEPQSDATPQPAAEQGAHPQSEVTQPLPVEHPTQPLPTMPADGEAAVTRVHAELSDLKHKLH